VDWEPNIQGKVIQHHYLIQVKSVLDMFLIRYRGKGEKKEIRKKKL